MATQQLFFFDSRVSNWQSLTAQLPPGARWFELNAREDGVQQILRALQGVEGLSAIQIVSHGEPGMALIGSTALDTTAIVSGASQWAAIGASLSEGGDILLYGCEVGSGLAGNAFLQALAAATGADVAANADLTGLGGDWTLEATAGGAIETQPLLAQAEVGTLAAPVSVVSFVVGGTATVDAGGTTAIPVLKPTEWQVLRADLLSTITATNITYQWAADGTNLIGATNRYLFLDQSLVGKAISVTVTYVDGGGLTQFLTSAPSFPVANVNDPPLGAVTISGTPQEGETLTASNTLSDGDGPSVLGVSYQWKANGVDIEGATTSKLLLTQAQVGKAITVQASYTDALGTQEAVLSASTSAVVDIDSATTGSVTITGQATQGVTLTGTHNLADPDGLGTVRWQWYADGQAISGAVDSTLLLTQDLVGKVITLTASALDGLQNQINRTSAPTFPVSNVNDPPKGNVTITGVAQEDSQLTAANSLTDADGLGGISYQWQANGIDIPGATSDTLQLSQALVGKSITVEARYTDGLGKTERVVSASTAAVIDVDHATTGTVDITGLASQGATLTVSHTLADADGMGTVRYQWKADGLDISRQSVLATGSSLQLTQEDVGKVITVVASFTDGAGNLVSRTSVPTFPVSNVNDPPKGSVTITVPAPGDVKEGVTLTAVNDLSDADGPATVGVAYQWFAAGVPISGATSNKLFLSQAQVGKSITVEARYTDAFGNQERVLSASTSAVADVDSATTGGISITGLARQGQTLTATSTLEDPDGLGTIAYQWSANGSSIAGATESSFTPSQAEVGKVITVVASFTDGAGIGGSTTSAPTAPVANVNDPPGGSVTISGDAEEDKILTANASSLSDADGMGVVSFQWYTVENFAQGAAFTFTRIPGATASTLTLSQAQVGKAIAVEAVYLDKFGNDEAVLSASTSAVVNVSHPLVVDDLRIVGERRQGETLAVAYEFKDKDGIPTTGREFFWRADGDLIQEGTRDTLLLTQREVGKTITVEVRYRDGEGTLEIGSDTTVETVANLNDAPSGAVTIAGIPTQGGTLYATNNLIDIDGIPTSAPDAISYQWMADGVNVSGATASSLPLTQDHVGKTISVVATYKDGGGTTERVFSSATAAVQNVNDVPGGAVTITGTEAQGSTLTATNTLADADGLGAITYQWRADGNLITGAAGNSYTLTQAEVGKTITVTASYTDGGGKAEGKTSAATLAVTNVNDAPTGGVTISGTATQGQTLSVSNTLSDADGIPSVTYQWNADGIAIAGATGNTLVLTQAQVGKAITVTASYTDNSNQAESVTSAATSAVANVNDAPVGTVTIGGSPAEDKTLTVTHDLTDPDGAIGPVRFQWTADGVDIAGATAATLALGQPLVGRQIAVKAIFTDASGTLETVTSAATANVANVNDSPVGVVTISGKAEENQILTVANSIVDEDGIATSGTDVIKYQWNTVIGSTHTPIPNQTGGNLLLTDALVGKQISVTATYKDLQGTVETVTSGITDKVGNVNDLPTGSVLISGPAEQGKVLTADASALKDDDGVGAITLQWRANGIVLAGQTGNTLLLAQQHVGKVITVTASYLDGNGTVESVISSGTLQVANVNDLPPAGAVTFTGAPEQRQVLTASNTFTDADGLGVVSYQWNTYDAATDTHTPIPGATSSLLTLLQAQVGKRISVTASYTDQQGTVESQTSGASNSAVANVNDLPTGNLVINGTTTQGQTLTAVSTIVDLDGIPASGPGAINYQWSAANSGSTNYVNIAGATGSTYVLTQADVGKLITVTASYVDLAGAAGSMTSAPRGAVANVNDAPTGFEKITGVPVPGNVLTVPDGLADADGLGTVRYQWRADGTAIPGATASTFATTSTQLGKIITVTASYTDGFGTAETKTSSGLAIVSSVDITPPTVSSFSPLDGAAAAPVASDIVLTFNESVQRGSGTILLKTASGATVEIFDAATSARLSIADKVLTLNPSSDLQFGTSYVVEFPAGSVKDSAGNLYEGVKTYDFTTAAAPSAGLQGMAYHWKSHVLLNDVNVKAANAADVAGSVDLFDLRAASYDSATGVLSVQVWVNPTTPMESLQFSARNVQGGAAVFTSALASAATENDPGWTLVSSTDPTTGVTTVAAILSDPSSTLAKAGAQQIGTLQITLPAGTVGAQVRFSGITVGDASWGDQTLGLASQATGVDGKYSLSFINQGSFGLEASRPIADSGSAVTAADALAALRIAVGINPNPDPDVAGPKTAPAVSPYQIMAADVNGSGTVTAADALAILRMAVKLPTALPQEWFFVEEKRDFWDEVNQKFTLNRTNATWDHTITADPAGGPVNLVGVLKGDVNGSWAAPTGSIDLDNIDPNYFQNLAQLIGVPNQDQWGGPPPGP